MTKNKKKIYILDGNSATSLCSYNFTEIAFVYPITPSTQMAENVDFYAFKGKKNFFGSKVKIVEMQGENGVAGAVHGALQSGIFATTYTSSQGLLLMIPNIYKMVGECLPGVIHVASRSIATRSLSIFGDHQDVYAIRQTGITMLCSSSVQEAADLAGIAHLIAIDSSFPICHFFDGFRTSHEMQSIEILQDEEIKKIIPFDKIKEFRNRSLNPHFNPVSRGAAENEDLYFQGREAQNICFKNTIYVAEKYLKKISLLTGRDYSLFTYYGSKNAKYVIVAMGSVTECVKEVIDNLGDDELGLIKVHLYRPFSVKHFISSLPHNIKKIAVLDRTKECYSSSGEPLYLDVVAALSQYDKKNVSVYGGRYGLASKDVQPKHIKAVFDFIRSDNPWNSFTVGIDDDVTKLSIPVDDNFNLKNDYTSCLFYGVGGDGTVSANKSSIEIISKLTNQHIQAYFQYDARKSNGITRSHLRFGKNAIRSTYFIKNADFISCSLDTYIFKINMLENLKDGGTFLLNSSFDSKKLINVMPDYMKFLLAKKKAKMFVIDANKISSEIGIGRYVNTILQSSFFYLNRGIISFKEAKEMMKNFAKKKYSYKGEDIVNMNFKAIESSFKNIKEIKIDEKWLALNRKKNIKYDDEYFEKYVNIVDSLNGDSIPTSFFLKNNLLDGTLKHNTSFKRKIKIADKVPFWHKENCLQCNRCAFFCPHAAIRPFLLNDDEVKRSPEIVKNDLVKAFGESKYSYKLQISSQNCTGCGLCAKECLANKNGKLALEMIDAKTQFCQEEGANYLFNNISFKNKFSIDSVKGVSFLKPYMEMSGACPGCGETPYYELFSRLFGKDALVANATGCSSIYSCFAPSNSFCTDKDGNGIAWANSLLEDNAEFGFGMRMAIDYKLNQIISILSNNKNKCEKELANRIDEYIINIKNREKSRLIIKRMIPLIEKSSCEEVKEVLKYKNYFIDKTVWIIGGDGWAYDIGYGGLDHVLSSNADVNILILDTEVYSNTGGQSSKSTQIGAVSKFDISGKKLEKKNLSLMAITYGHVYVAQIVMSSLDKTVKVLKEAENYHKGPSLIICYSPCVNHGIKGGMANSIDTEKKAVECGFFIPFHFNPDNLNTNKSLMVIDSDEPDFTKFRNFLMQETRFSELLKNNSNAEEIFKKCEDSAKKRFNMIKKISLIFDNYDNKIKR